MSEPTDFYAEALVMTQLGGQVIEADDIGAYAIEYAFRGWRVFPLVGKLPAIPNPHPKGSRDRVLCKGECGLAGHGVLDATTDYITVNNWWSRRYRGCNIGVRLPDGLIVIDVDPRHDGHLRLAELEAKHGKLPTTRRVFSGRSDGGVHYYFRRPPGKLSSRRLGDGVDLKTSAGYVVGPPSIHPDSGLPYWLEPHPVAATPRWLAGLLLPEAKSETLRRPARPFSGPLGDSIADSYSANATWRGILEPHGWQLVSGDGESDGSAWRHPTATSPVSATVRHACLFTYSPNTPFEVTEAGDPNGITRFKAYAILNHNGDQSAAARVLRAEATNDR